MIDYKQIDKNSKKLFMIKENTEMSYQKLFQQVELITGLFTKYNIKANDEIVVMSNDSLKISVLFIASLLNGITVVILDKETKQERLNSILTLLNPKALFFDKEYINIIDDQKNFKVFNLSDKKQVTSIFSKIIGKEEIHFLSELKKSKQIIPSFKALLDDTAYILFTSGTTSSPKGVMISYENLLEHLKTLQKVYMINDNSSILNILSLSHTDGIIQGPVLSFISNITYHRPFEFKIQEIDKLITYIEKKHVTHFVTVPIMLSLLLQYGSRKSDNIKQSNLLYIGSAAAMLEVNLWKSFQDTFGKKIINIYGLTETVTGGFFTNPDNDEHIGTIGTPIDCIAKVIDDNQNELPDGEIGELIMSGKNVMKGYYGNQQLTIDVIKNGWLYTGDLAIKKDGLYSIVGRKKNIILSGGFTIFPEEIIEVLNSNENIIESIVLGIEHNIFGEEIVACVIIKQGSSINESKLLKYCEKYLEVYKLPRKIKIVDILPKGPSGKIITSEVKKMYFNKAIENQTNDLVKNKLFEIASNCFLVPLEQISESSSPETITTWDSLGHLEFISAIEKDFDISFGVSELLSIESMSDTLEIVKSKVNEKK